MPLSCACAGPADHLIPGVIEERYTAKVELDPPRRLCQSLRYDVLDSVNRGAIDVARHLDRPQPVLDAHQEVHAGGSFEPVKTTNAHVCPRWGRVGDRGTRVATVGASRAR